MQAESDDELNAIHANAAAAPYALDLCAHEDLLEDESPPAEEDAELPTLQEGTWVIVRRHNKEQVGQVVEDKCDDKQQSIKVHPWVDGNLQSGIVKCRRKKVIRVLKMNADGEPALPPVDGDASGGEQEQEQEEQEEQEEEGEEEEEEEEEEQPKKKRARKQKVEVDHKEACTSGRVWAMEQLKLNKYKSASSLSDMAQPDLVRMGTDDKMLARNSKTPATVDGGVCMHNTLLGRALSYSNGLADNLQWRNVFASILVMMLTTANNNKYCDLKSLKAYVSGNAHYNVKGHLCRDVMKLDHQDAEAKEYVRSMYTMLEGALTGSAPAKAVVGNPE